MPHPLRQTYDTWYSNNRSQILLNQWQLVDANLLHHPDHLQARGLNLISYLSSQINQNIDRKLIPKLIDIIGNSGYLVSPLGRHLTILDIIPHNSGIPIETIKNQSSSYVPIINHVISSFHQPIEIEFNGIFASPDGITLQGFPSPGLDQLRLLLRQSLSASGLINLETNKYSISTAHVALIKFIAPLDGSKLIDLVDQLRNFPLGSLLIAKFCLNISSRYDKINTIEVVQNYQFQ